MSELSERRREERRAVDEGGGGQSEGFELSEQELIEHASHGDEHRPFRIMRDAGGGGADERQADEADGVRRARRESSRHQVVSLALARASFGETPISIDQGKPDGDGAAILSAIRSGDQPDTSASGRSPC